MLLIEPFLICNELPLRGVSATGGGRAAELEPVTVGLALSWSAAPAVTPHPQPISLE